MSQLKINQFQSPLRAIQKAFESLTIAGSLFFSHWIVGQHANPSSATAIATAVVLYLIFSELNSPRVQNDRRSPGLDLVRVLLNWTLTVMSLAVLAFFTRHGEYFARSSILAWILVTGASLGLVQMLFYIGMDLLYSTGWIRRRCAVAGLNELGVQLLNNSRSNPECGLELVAFFDDRLNSRLQLDEQAQGLYRGKLDLLVEQARSGSIDTVFITLPMRAENRIRWLLDQLADTTASVYIVPDFFVFELLHSRWNSIGGLPAVSVFESPLYGVDGIAKRAFDVVAATVGLLLLLPVFIVCGIMVKLSSEGPVFFRQLRYGLDGRKIRVWKFRTMKTCENGPAIQQAQKCDPRITRVGAILRRTSLDELPQLFNVIEGSMSLVGPRPHATAHNEHYRKLIKGYMLRHKVRPGITGLAQVKGFRGETETLDKMQRRVEFDHQYIQQWSLWLDVKIILGTFLVVFKQENAY